MAKAKQKSVTKRALRAKNPKRLTSIRSRVKSPIPAKGRKRISIRRTASAPGGGVVIDNGKVIGRY